MKISLRTHIINVDSLCPPLAVMKAKHKFSFHFIYQNFLCVWRYFRFH